MFQKYAAKAKDLVEDELSVSGSLRTILSLQG
jgi:hypothetical protein